MIVFNRIVEDLKPGIAPDTWYIRIVTDNEENGESESHFIKIRSELPSEQEVELSIERYMALLNHPSTGEF